MKITIFILLIVIFLVFLSKDAEKKRMINWKLKLKNDFGEIPDQEYTSEYFKGLQGYYKYKKKDKGNIDDITFNDLDLKNVFMLINNTSSSIGEEYLYYILRQLSFDEETLLERDRIMQYFASHEEERVNFQFLLCKLGKMPEISVFEYMNRMKEMVKYSISQSIFCVATFVLSIGVLAFEPRIGIMAICITLCNNIYQYYKRKAKIENYIKTLSYIVRVLHSVDELDKLGDPFLKPYFSKMKNARKNFRYIKRNAVWISCGSSMNGSVVDSLMDYVRMLFHIDLIKFSKMIDIINKNSEELVTIYETIGLLDSMVAAASFRESLDYYCIPKLVHDKKPFIDTKDIFHPLLDDPVVNSIKEKQSVLITGSNASGKSTFIKTLALNAILSQTIYTSTSRSYSGNYYRVFTSMALRDDIFNNESYYIVEIKSLKRIIDAMNEETPILCFVDEVLRGTNTLERIAASSQILKSLSKGYVLCFAATHDIELTYILENRFSNYHFKEEVVDNDVIFDYLLCNGRAESRNAIKLLRMIGYQEEIINEATNAANKFLIDGTWETV